MRKSNEINTFNDTLAKVTESLDENLDLTKVEVLYGARDEANQPIEPGSDDDGHGTWIAFADDGEYYIFYWKRAAYEGGDVEIDDLDKLEETISTKKRIIAEAEKIQDDTNWPVILGKYKELMAEWKTLPYWRMSFENNYWKKFQAAQSHFYDALRANHDKNKELKNEIVKKAQELKDSEEWRKTTQAFKDLLADWKKIGSAGHEEDEKLWRNFHEANEEFFQRKADHWASLQPAYEEAKAKKEELIEKAKEISDSTEWKKTSEDMKNLMSQWREAGFAGKDNDDLWEAFNGERQKFYEARTAYFDQLDAEHKEHVEAKKKLIAQAHEIAHGLDFSRENTQKMKDLQAQWKEVGSAGRKKENELWKQFREEMDLYFDNLRTYALPHNRD